MESVYLYVYGARTKTEGLTVNKKKINKKIIWKSTIDKMTRNLQNTYLHGVWATRKRREVWCAHGLERLVGKRIELQSYWCTIKVNQ